MRAVLMISAAILMSGCDWQITTTSDGLAIEPEEHHPTDVRVNNRTDQPVIIRYVSAGGIDYRVTIPIGGRRTFEAWPRRDAIKADYRHIIHWYDIPDECDVVIDLHADDFVPATPVANG